MLKTISMPIFLFIIVFVICSSFIFAQTDDELKKREKEFKKVAKTLESQGITTGSIGEKLNDLFKEYVTRGSCGLVDSNRIDAKYSFVPDEIPNQDSVTGVKTRRAEVIKANGIKMFWYVYTSNDKNNPNLNDQIVKTRFLSTFFDQTGGTTLTPSRFFSNWILSRNCTGYLNTKADASANFFTISASAAIQADFKNTASIVLIGGSFNSPLPQKLIRGGWSQRLIDLDTWNLYSQHSTIIDDAWIMNSFDGVMANREVGISRNFKFDGSVSGNASIPIGNIAGSLKTGILEGTTMDFTQYQLLIASDMDNQALRDTRFTKLSTVEQISKAIKTTPLELANQENKVTRGLNSTYIEKFQGMPQNICESNWEIIDSKKNVFDTVSVRSTYQPFDKVQEDQIPTCLFFITGQPKESIFNQPRTPDFEAIIRNVNNNLRVRTTQLELSVKRSFNTSQHPIPSYVRGTNSISFLPELDGSTFGVSWRDIDIVFEDQDARVKMDKGTSGTVEPVNISNCSNFDDFRITADLISTGSLYQMTLRSNMRLSSVKYFTDNSEEVPCQYQTSIQVPLENGNRVTRQLVLNLKVPKKKPTPTPTPIPVITPLPTPIPTPTP